MIGTPTSTPSPSLPKSNLPMLYYGLVIAATAAIVLVLYNLVVLRWCTDQPGHRTPRSTRRRQGPTPAWRINTYSFKYKRESGDSECAVCLSVFEEGEEIRQLPQCNHYFHAPCIDMWLYSHMDCPLCRSPVDPPEHSRQELLGV